MRTLIAVQVLAYGLTPVALGAQQPLPESPPGLGVTVAVSFTQMRESVLNPLRHQGPALRLGVFHEGLSDAGIHRVEASFSFASLSDRYARERASLLFHPRIQLQYARRAGRIGDNLTYYVGGTVGYGTRFAFFEDWDQGHPYWLTSAELGATGVLARRLAEGGSVRIRLDAPVLAAVSRPPRRFEYKEVNPALGWVFEHIHQGMRLTSVLRHTALNARVEYRRAPRGLLRQHLFWETSYTSSRMPGSRPITILTHSVGIAHPF